MIKKVLLLCLLMIGLGYTQTNNSIHINNNTNLDQITEIKKVLRCSYIEYKFTLHQNTNLVENLYHFLTNNTEPSRKKIIVTEIRNFRKQKYKDKELIKKHSFNIGNCFLSVPACNNIQWFNVSATYNFIPWEWEFTFNENRKDFYQLGLGFNIGMFLPTENIIETNRNIGFGFILGPSVTLGRITLGVVAGGLFEQGQDLRFVTGFNLIGNVF